MGSWSDHTQRRLASVVVREREKTWLCRPATKWVPRNLDDNTAERFPATRKSSRIASELPVLTEGASSVQSHIAPHMAGVRNHLAHCLVFVASCAASIRKGAIQCSL
jgi:hypothetical protein